jgi:uncharacterized protein (TIGR02646 family)
MIHVNRTIEPDIFESEDVKTTKEIISNFFAIPSSERSQKSFKFPEPSDTIKKEVVSLFKNKCAYCESALGSFSPSHIDNFRPRRGARGLSKGEFYDDHYWWLALEWNNLYLACSECSSQKATFFPIGSDRAVQKTYGVGLLKETPLFLDPCNDLPDEHLGFDTDGTVFAYSDRGTVTINFLKLNREGLILSRKEAIQKLVSILELLTVGLNQSISGRFSIESFLEKNHKSVSFVLELLTEHPSQTHAGALSQFLFSWLKNQPPFIEKLFALAQDFPYLIDTSITLLLLENQSWRKKIEQVRILSGNKLTFNNKLIPQEQFDTIERIEIKNFKGIGSLDIVIPKEQGNFESWLLLLGENGVGKSSVLQAIAIALIGQRYRDKIGLKASDILRKDQKEGSVSVFFKGKRVPISIDFSESSNIINGRKNNSAGCIIGYGATRLMENKRLKAEDAKSSVRIGNLFDPTIALHNANKWLTKLDKVSFDYAARTLKKLLLLDDDDIILKSQDTADTVLVQHNKKVNTIEQMSDGYKAVIALAVDIMQTLQRQGTTMEEAKGIVLIDEIEAHLHPRWQMRIVKRFRDVFPYVQFIVTSHEPLCLRGMLKNETVVMRRDENRDVEYITDLPSPEDLKVEQLLTSEFFGLNSTTDPEVEDLFNEYYYLLALNERTNEQRERVEFLKVELKEKKQLGSSLREELMYEAIDNLLAKKYLSSTIVRKEDLKEETINAVKEIWENISFNEPGE